MVKLLINDGNRHMKATGYGQLARSIILSLNRYSNFDVRVQKRVSKWDDVPNKEELTLVKEVAANDYEIILKIGAPSKFLKENIPTLWYTQNALGRLKEEWIDYLKIADGLIVPGKFDSDVFKKNFDNVFVCPQVVDDTIFKPVPKYRKEGNSELSFIYVGSYSYRKGIDLLLKYFKKTFSNRQRISLTLHCFTGLEGNGLNHLVDLARDLPSNINLRIFNGSVSPAWMNRIYNQHDVVLSFSRGEGWCMPLHEGLLCCKPVIAPQSTAMGEALPDFGVRKVKVHECFIDDIQDDFGKSMKINYGGENNFYWEPDEKDSIDALVEVCDKYKEFEFLATRARDFIVQNYSLEIMAKNIQSAVDQTCKKL